MTEAALAVVNEAAPPPRPVNRSNEELIKSPPTPGKRGGEVSAEQRRQIDKLCAAGAATVVARSVAEVEAWLRGWGIELRATLLPGGGVRINPSGACEPVMPARRIA